MHHRSGRLHRKVSPTPARAGGAGIGCGCEMGRSATHHRPTCCPRCCSHLAKRLKSEGHYIVGCGEAQPADRTLAAPLRCRVTSRNAHCGLATNLFAWLPPACRLEAQRAHAGEHAWPMRGCGAGGGGSPWRLLVCCGKAWQCGHCTGSSISRAQIVGAAGLWHQQPNFVSLPPPADLRINAAPTRPATHLSPD